MLDNIRLKAGAAVVSEALQKLVGSKVREVYFEESLGLLIKGVSSNDQDEVLWRLLILGSARFTFSNQTEQGSWLVEANFDAGGLIRRNERVMMQSLQGAILDEVDSHKGLSLRSHDGRALEIPYVLNEEALILEIYDAVKGPTVLVTADFHGALEQQ